jgi:hypothetical protein
MYETGDVEAREDGEDLFVGVRCYLLDLKTLG